MDQTPKEPRSPVNLRIKFRSESLEQFVERYAIDVSRGGIFIRTREPLAVGTQLKLDFQYQSGSPLMAGDGTVVWIRDPDPNRPTVPPGMGVRFDRLTPESQAVLEQLLTEKAAREKSGAGHPTAGGMAVRRPSSMFAALDQNEAKTTVGPMPSAPPAAEPLGAHAPPPPRYTVAAMPLVAQGIPGMNKPPAQPRANLAAPLTATESAAGGYKPLGNARNPFSVGGDAAAAKGDPGAVARMAATILGTGAKAPASSLRELGREATGADDLDEEPTQIAGRVPAFLVSDEDPTSVGARPSADHSRITTEQPAATGRNLARLTSSINRPSEPRAFGAAANPSKETVRVESAPGLAGMGRVTGHISDQAAESPRLKASLDSMPLGGPASAPRRGGIDRGTDALLDPEPRFSRPGLGMPEQPRPFDPLAAFGSGPTAIAETPAPTPPPAAVPTPVRTTPPKAVPAATASAAKPPAKRSSGLMVGAIVLVLGGAAFFVFRFFQSQASQVVSVPGSTGSATSIAPAPTAGEPVAPAVGTNEPGAPAATAKEDSPGSAGEAKPGEAKPAEAKLADTKSADTKSAEAKPVEAKPADTKSAEAKPSAVKPAEAKPPVAASKPVAVVEHKVMKRKPVRGARETEAVPAAAPAPTPAAPAAAPAAPAAPEAAASGHQIRVTSKPAGADVAIDGQVVGQTPLTTGISDVSSPHFVSLRKEGFEPFEQMISASSAWAKGKPAKGQPAIPTLKINAKLKSASGAAGGEGKAAPAGDGAKEAPAGKADPDSPAPPSDIAPAPAAP